MFGEWLASRLLACRPPSTSRTGATGSDVMYLWPSTMDHASRQGDCRQPQACHRWLCLPMLPTPPPQISGRAPRHMRTTWQDRRLFEYIYRHTHAWRQEPVQNSGPCEVVPCATTRVCADIQLMHDHTLTAAAQPRGAGAATRVAQALPPSAPPSPPSVSVIAGCVLLGRVTCKSLYRPS